MLDRITFDPNVLGGCPTIRGLRISVAHIVNLMGKGMTPEEGLAEHLDFEREDIAQALRYAALAADDRIVELPRPSN